MRDNGFREGDRRCRGGKLASDARKEALAVRRLPTGHEAIGVNTLVTALVKEHLSRASEECRTLDSVDPITLLIATSLRESELLGLLWSDFDVDTGTLSVTGKVFRATGQGLQRHDTAKSEACLRTLPLPSFAIDVLKERRQVCILKDSR